MKIVCFTKNDKKWTRSEIKTPAIDIKIVRDMNYDYVTGHYFYHTYPSNQLWACEEPNEDNVQDKCRIIVQETGLFFRREFVKKIIWLITLNSLSNNIKKKLGPDGPQSIQKAV